MARTKRVQRGLAIPLIQPNTRNRRKLYHRKVITITAEDSPNVRRGMLEKQHGLEPSNKTILPGVITWAEYQNRLKTWDEIRKTIGLWAKFHKGKRLLLFPPDWLDNSHRLHEQLVKAGIKRVAKALGIDPAEGGDKTSMSVVDEYGLIEQVSKQTPDTNVIPYEAIDFMKQYNVPPNRVLFDRGGGGTQHADRMRAMGYPVRTVGFGETISLEPRHGMILVEEKKDIKESRYSYINKRGQMYGEASQRLDPSNDESGYGGYAIPEEYYELRRQLAPLERLYDAEGRLWLPPKSKKNKDSKIKTLQEILGCSPDEADSFVLAIHAMEHEETEMTAGML